MGCLRFDNLPTSLFCHRLDNMHWTEPQQTPYGSTVSLKMDACFMTYTASVI